MPFGPCHHPRWSVQTSCPCQTTACSPCMVCFSAKKNGAVEANHWWKEASGINKLCNPTLVGQPLFIYNLSKKSSHKKTHAKCQQVRSDYWWVQPCQMPFLLWLSPTFQQNSQSTTLFQGLRQMDCEWSHSCVQNCHRQIRLRLRGHMNDTIKTMDIPHPEKSQGKTFKHSHVHADIYRISVYIYIYNYII